MMPDSPFFTIVVATFNRGRHIIPTIEAALDQTVTDFELLIVGDGVTDDTLVQVPREDPRLRVIELTTLNSGSQSMPNNAGIAAARGRYVAYLGHDDIWMPDHLANLAQIFMKTGCDVAVAGCAYHGPPGTDLLLVTGLFKDSSAARRHFFPPSSFAHRLSLASQIGGWRAPQTTKAPVDCDFLLRSVDAGARFVSTGRVTVHKFAAGHRYLSYIDQSSSEQCEMLAAIRSGAIDRGACVNYVKRAKAAGTFMRSLQPELDGVQPGDSYRVNRSNKGLDRAASVPLTEEVRVLPSNDSRALDWYWLEQRDGSPPFRWSGPSLRPKLLIPFTGDVSARITVHLFDHDPAGIIDTIRLTLNGHAIAHRTRRVHSNRVDLEITGRLRPEQPSVLELILPGAFCPAEAGWGRLWPLLTGRNVVWQRRWGRLWSMVSGRNLDWRRLGVALTGFTVAPLAPAPSDLID
jgi:glycosyltransferase involved in cell wall biosynthesis